MMYRSLMIVAIVTAAGFCASPLLKAQNSQQKILVFIKTAGFHHGSIPAGVQAIQTLGSLHGFGVDVTNDAANFATANLANYAAVVFLNTSGDVLNDAQQAAFEAYIRSGKGYVGIHAASDTEYGWDWYGNLLGARFANHPPIQSARIIVNDANHLSTQHLVSPWQRTDEWYNFDANPRVRVGKPLQLLLTLDEQSYTGGTMGREHPISWCHEFEGGRSWYTAGGHTDESYTEPAFVAHLLGGIQWAAKMKINQSQTPAASQPSDNDEGSSDSGEEE